MITIVKSAERAHRRQIFSMAASLTLTSVLAASLAAGTAVAQEEGAPQSTASGEVLEQVTVTGTRIRRDGYDAPTPVSVLGTEALEKMAVGNIATAVNRMPVFTGSVTNHNSGSTYSNDTGGANHLNLRGLGPTRTLVLLNGRRVVGSTIAGFSNNGGAVDINAFPNGLIERVEVVTGGASAVYGSDALAGVVNFILDTDYTGFKATLQGGITSHGDNGRQRASFTAGIPFADGRGHFLFSGEHAYEDSVVGKPRDWADHPYSILANPNYTSTNGQPEHLAVFDTGLSVATRGGLIVSCSTAPGTPCPLRGTQFLEGGTPAQFDFGPIISGVMMQGGDWQQSTLVQDVGLAVELKRDNLFTRASYDISDSATVFASLHRSITQVFNEQGPPDFHLGNITILSGNPFIPDPVQAEMTALGIPSFTMGTVNGDVQNIQLDSDRRFTRYVVGIEGELDAVGTDWLWDASYVRGTNEVIARTLSNRITANYTRAVDAVVDDGRVVCGVNADADPTNDDPACAPLNPMGFGVISQAAVDYAYGRGHMETLLEQDVVAVSATGEPFSSWAGPVSLAFGAAHRREAVSGWASALDEADSFLAGNYHASQGKYDVTEGYVETVVPLASDQPFAESLDINGAVRWTDYSTSGEVVTWKVGASWRPIEDVRFRLTRSRDIRAPNLGDLFLAGSTGRGTVTDPFNNNVETSIITTTTGNPNLEPEEADTTGIGVVLTPSFLPGFGASVDYYDIQIEGAISRIGSQDYVDRCFAGVTALCSFIGRDANGFINAVSVSPANILSQSTSGIDLDLKYTFPLSNISSNWDGDLSFRARATHVLSIESVDAGIAVEGAGTVGGVGLGTDLRAPDLRYLTSATYNNDPVAITLTMRGRSSAVYSHLAIECAPGACPASTPEHPTINNNYVDGITYFDLAFNYAFYGDGAEAFVVVQNALDEDPPAIPGCFYCGLGNDSYDRLGRLIRAGVRIEF